MKKLATIKLLFFQIPIPNFATTTLPLNLPKKSAAGRDLLIEKEAPNFSLRDTSGSLINLSSSRGTPSVVTFINLWNPTSASQIKAIDALLKKTPYKATLVVEGEPQEKVSIYKKRG